MIVDSPTQHANQLGLTFLRDVDWMRQITPAETFTIEMYMMMVRGELLMLHNGPTNSLGVIQQLHANKLRTALSQHVSSSDLRNEGIQQIVEFTVDTNMFYEATTFSTYKNNCKLSFHIHRNNEMTWIDIPSVELSYNHIEHVNIPLHYVTEYESVMDTYFDSHIVPNNNPNNDTVDSGTVL